MSKPSRIGKSLVLPLLLAATFVGVQFALAAPPNASFTATGPGGTNTCGLWTFASTSTDPDDDIATFDWNLGGTGTQGNPVTATFATPGQRTINLTVTDTDAVDGTADQAQATQTINVGNGGPPNASFTASDASPQPNQAVTFTSNSTVPGGGSIATYEWDPEGDGSYVAGGATMQAAFATTGPHTIGLHVIDNCGGQDFFTNNIFVNNTAPTASFTVTPNPAALGATVNFNGSASTDAGGAIASYEWDLDGNGSYETVTTTPTTSRVYNTSGTFNVKLRVIDNNGSPSAPAFDNLRVNAPPTAAFAYAPVTPVINEQVTFNGSASTDADGTVATYDWDLDGNGSFETTGVSPTPVHTYTAPGTYNVKLRVTDNDGTQSLVLDRDVIVQPTRPKASFTFSPAHPLPGQAVTLRSTSAPSGAAGAPALVATQWDFVYSPLTDFTLDGAGASIVTSFATAGAHTVAIRVTETGGGFAIAYATIPVNALPVAAFTVAPAKPREGRQITFASTSIDGDGIAKQEWDLDNDGKFERSGAVASTSKLKAGKRKIKLRVTDRWGAAVTATKTIKVGRTDVPPKTVISHLSYYGKPWGIRLNSFTVESPAKTRITVTCKGRGCPRGAFHKRTRKKRATLSFPAIPGNLRAGAKINVLYATPGRITGWDTITVRGNTQRVVIKNGCKFTGKQKRWKRCPS